MQILGHLLREMVRVEELFCIGVADHIITQLVHDFSPSLEASMEVMRTKGPIAHPDDFSVDKVICALAALLDQPVEEVRVLIVEHRS